MEIEQISLPRIVVSKNIKTALPLEHTAVSAHITGLTAEVSISQRFRNPLANKTDLEYLFPLPHKAVVTGFEFRVGERIIKGGVYEIEQARQGFEQARKKGQRTSLLEQRRPDLFALQLANIQPGEIIHAVTSYQQALQITEEGCEFVFPMGITPRYHKQGDESQAELLDAPIAASNTEIG
ncbi:MAG: VIT domain-containing protein, partial [Chloroflexota bacterium]